MVEVNITNFITIGLIAMIFAWLASKVMAKMGVSLP